MSGHTPGYEVTPDGGVVAPSPPSPPQPEKVMSKVDVLAVLREMRRLVPSISHFDPTLCLNPLADEADAAIAAVTELIEAGNDWCDLMPGLAGGPEFDRFVAALTNAGGTK